MTKALRIAVASGKGGTGKTTIATSLAAALAESAAPVAYVDCDVEEPNGHLFLRPEIEERREVSIPVPEVDVGRCDLCGACGDACRYSAIVALPNQVLTFPKLCHGCGGCAIACPTRAIREVPRVTGVVEWGRAGPLTFVQGRLDVGEAMAPPVIRAALAAAPKSGTVVIDAPPGTSCPVVESVKAADVVLLVTEPTPFGLHDLELAVEMVRDLGVPFGVAVNRASVGGDEVRELCSREGIPLLLEVPNDRVIAEAYSRGELATSAVPELRPRLLELAERLAELARSGRPSARHGEVRAPATPPRGALPAFPSSEAPPGAERGVRELVVVSGKGGTGKTSIVASFAALAAEAGLADCDVDAADLHLVLEPEVQGRWPFSGGKTAVVDPERCTGCWLCVDLCRFGAIRGDPTGAEEAVRVEAVSCEGCGVCVDNCPAAAISLAQTEGGEWLVSETRHGPMTHARLGVAQENSGKLVSLVRREAKAVTGSQGRDLLICDGSPGIGCPVIASITGARLVLLVTEPTLSGRHDLERVAELCGQLEVEAGVCINKVDINPEVAAAIEADAAARGISVLGRVRYDDAVTAAQVAGRAVVEIEEGPAASDVRALWQRVRERLA